MTAPARRTGPGGPVLGPVTVVIPTKDRYETLTSTLASVLAQRHVDVSVVVVEDGGSDGTATRLHGSDRRVTALRHRTSLGVSSARNTGLAEVATPWVAFVDDDDVWAPDKLARQLRVLATEPASRWACSAAAVFDSDGRVLGVHPVPDEGDLSVSLLQANVVPGGGSGVLCETALVREVGGFDPSLSNLADWDCWIRLAQRASVARVASADVGYRRNSTSMIHKIDRSEAELTQMRATHAALYAAAGVDVDWVPWLWYLQGLAYAGGGWSAGARRSWQLFRQHGQIRALAQPVRYALPSVARWREARWIAQSSTSEHAAAEQWLRAVLTGERAADALS